MPQCASAKGCAAIRRAWVAAHSRQNRATPHIAQPTSMGAPSCSADKPTTAGGATRMKTVGRSRSGHRPATPTRTSSSTSATGQNTSPMPNCAAAHSACPSGTPAKGAITLPTTGMNSAGVMPAHCRPPAWLPRHQRASTQTMT